jgi:formylglycine-generating enzyme required for sulfatase activity
MHGRLADWSRALRQSLAASLGLEGLRAKYHQLAAVKEAGDLAGRVRSLRLAVEDQRVTLGDRYPKGDAYLARVAALEQAAAAAVAAALASSGAPPANLAALGAELDKAAAEILLANPLLDFDKLLVVRGSPNFQSNWDGPNHLGSDLVVVSPVRADGKQTLLRHEGWISDFDLNWDGRRILFSNGRALFEIQADGTGLRQVSAKDPPVWHYDGCYLPNGQIACVSNACEQAVPCTGGANVGNLHILNADGSGDHRVCFEQDQDWNPTVMQDGRILYTRWEYADIPHYFSRLLFRMNPDGSNQMEYYHSNSYWPNATFWPRPIPGHPTEIVAVISGHHGVSRTGELVLLDPALGRHEAQGCLQRLPGYGRKVEAIIEDQLVLRSWPKFACPWPLAEPKTNRGAGKYFLVSVKRDESATWDLCLVDIFDNITPILTGGFLNGVPLRPRPKPPIVPSLLTPGQQDGIILLADIYRGKGLRGYPRGSIKQLRIGSYEYRFAGNGDTYAASNEGGWDVKKILGTVPVHEDGSAMFRVPANTPIFVQPLDAEGKAQQMMRSWYTAMPGETASCVGCHEEQNSGPPSQLTLAARAEPAVIAPWNGPTRGFSFDREVQPVLDRRCAGCHDGRPVRDGDRTVATPDLRAKRLRPDYRDHYSPAYMVLQKYVRRAGFESDIHMHVPSEFEADTSPLVQMLKKGHHNVRLTRDEWERLYTWIDFNVPYPLNWRESHVPPSRELVERRAKHQKLFAGIDDKDEEPLPLPPVAAFEPPAAAPAPAAAPLRLSGWPLTADAARKLQQATAAAVPPKELTLAGGVKMNFAVIPAGRFVMGSLRGAPNESPEAAVTIDRPFYLGLTEVTNAQYAAFDAGHDSGYIESRNKDRTSRGTPVNAPDQPVVRVSWNEALAFCRWLSRETGCRASLPTEAQWEWACRAGTATAFSFGDTLENHNGVMNIADSSIAGWNYGRSEPNYSDGYNFTIPVGRTPPNAWGLADMHGNAAEWCLSNYAPYPYDPRDGRDDPNVAGQKVVRGGSWNDLAKDSSSSARWRYQPYQPVYNVGFRVLIEIGGDGLTKTAAK